CSSRSPRNASGISRSRACGGAPVATTGFVLGPPAEATCLAVTQTSSSCTSALRPPLTNPASALRGHRSRSRAWPAGWSPRDWPSHLRRSVNVLPVARTPRSAMLVTESGTSVAAFGRMRLVLLHAVVALVLLPTASPAGPERVFPDDPRCAAWRRACASPWATLG